MPGTSTAASATTTSSSLRATLLAGRNADGGWPYYRGKSSRLEPTCAALIALGAMDEVQGVDVLEQWPRRDGLFVDAAGEINVAFNGLAAVTLAAQRPAKTGGTDRLREGYGGPPKLYAKAEAPPSQALSIARELVAALVRVKGVAVPKSSINRQDNTLQGWAWTVDTFSWVESTATCLLGLKRLVPGLRPTEVAGRIRESERVLFDRACRDGGWNHGNSNMLGKELPAYVPTTALALLALHDRAADAIVPRGVLYLRQNRLTETGGLALALTRICLGVYGVDAHDVEVAMAREWDRSAFLGNLHVIALALYGLTGAKSGYEAFRV